MPYTIGYDFGSESARALLVDVTDGRELACALSDYPHGVLEQCLPDGRALGADWALQHPGDWLHAIERCTRELLDRSGVSPDEICGMGLDCTACTALPCTADGTPLCRLDDWADEAHAWPKLWKHHAAQTWADRCNQVAAERGVTWLTQYGGALSSEWLFPKLAQIADEAPAVYAAAERFIEATDWIVWQLCGQELRNACCAGYKGCWDDQRGYPDADYLAAVHPLLADAHDKLGAVSPIGHRAGELDAAMARRTGLRPGTAVAVGLIDAHAAVPACGSAETGVLISILGTSSCDMACSSEKHLIPGMCGVVRDGILPGCYGYEAGQAGFGDHFAWLSRLLGDGDPGHDALAERAAALGPGGSGLLALDWWNGNRSPLQNAHLSGLTLGWTLRSDAADCYLALIEALCFGKRRIVEALVDGGVAVDRIVACGGIAVKNPLLLQTLADVTGREIGLARSDETCALGAAIHGAVAAQAHPDFAAATAAMGGLRAERYQPRAAAAEIYDELYRYYRELSATVEDGTIMRRLRELRSSAQPLAARPALAVP